MTKWEKIIDALEKAKVEFGVIRMSDQFRDILVDLMKEKEEEIKRLKGELHGFGDLFGELSEKAEKAIAEQPQIILCKDCKHGKINPCEQYTTCFLENSCLYGNTRKSNWFCADGERRTEE